MNDEQKFEELKHALVDKGANWKDLLDEREKTELVFAIVYASQFHHGTTGHIRLMLISKLTMFIQALTQLNAETVT